MRQSYRCQSLKNVSCRERNVSALNVRTTSLNERSVRSVTTWGFCYSFARISSVSVTMSTTVTLCRYESFASYSHTHTLETKSYSEAQNALQARIHSRLLKVLKRGYVLITGRCKTLGEKLIADKIIFVYCIYTSFTFLFHSRTCSA